MTDRDTATPRDVRVSADLRELATALHDMRVPPTDGEDLRRAFRAARKQPARSFEEPTRWRRAPLYASAAALVVSIATAIWVAVDRFGVDEARPMTVAPATPAPMASSTGAFQPLMYSPGVSLDGSYSVVRVRIPLSSLVIGATPGQGGTIEADVLVGEDGLARGIRFDEEDTLLVSTISR